MFSKWTFTPWRGCLPKKILLNSVIAKTSRRIPTYPSTLPTYLSTYVVCMYILCVYIHIYLATYLISISLSHLYGATLYHGPGPPRFHVSKSLNKFNNTLLTRDRPVARSLPTQDYTNTQTYASNGTPTHDTGASAVGNSRFLRLSDHWGRPVGLRWAQYCSGISILVYLASLQESL